MGLSSKFKSVRLGMICNLYIERDHDLIKLGLYSVNSLVDEFILEM